MHLNMVQFTPLSVKLKLRLKNNIESAKIIDIFATTPELLPRICSDDTLIRQSKCPQRINLIKKDETFTLSFDFYPKLQGKHEYTLYILVMINGYKNVIVTVDGTYHVKKHPYLDFFMSNNLFRVDLNEDNFDYLWLKNLRKGTSDKLVKEGQVMVNNMSGFGRNFLFINYPNNFKHKKNALEIEEKLQKQISKGNLDYWIVPPEQQRPILEIHIKQNSKELEDSRKNIKRTENRLVKLEGIRFEVMVNKSKVDINYNLFFGKNYKLWDHDFLNVGVLCSKEIWHTVPVYVMSKSDSPIFLINIFIEQDNYDFELTFSTNYRYGVALPFKGKRFIIGHLHVRYKGHKPFARISGKLAALINIFGEKKQENLNFFAYFHQDLFQAKTMSRNNVIQRSQKDFNIHIRQLSNSVFKKVRIEIVPDKTFAKAVPLTTFQHPRMNPNELYEIAKLNFRDVKNFYKVPKATFIIKVYALQNFFTLKVDFYFENFQCCTKQSKFLSFQDCRSAKNLSFQPFSETRLKQDVKFYIKNPGPSLMTFEMLKMYDFNPAFKIRLQVLTVPHIYRDFGALRFKHGLYKSFELDRKDQSFKMPFLNTLAGDMLQFRLFMEMPRDYKHDSDTTRYKSRITYYTRKGEEFTLNVSYSFQKGKLELYPRNITRNLIFPMRSNEIQVNVKSTFIKLITIDVPSKQGKSNELIEFLTFNMKIDPGINEKFLEFKINPHQLAYHSDRLFLKYSKQEYNKAITIRDIGELNYNKKLYKQIESKVGDHYSAKIVINTSLRTKNEIKIQGTIKKGSFFEKGNKINAVSDKVTSYHDITLFNPFSEPVSIQLYLVPTDFLEMKQIKNQLQKEMNKGKDPYVDKVACISNEEMSKETLQFYAKAIYDNSLDFIEGVKPKNVVNAKKYHCFKTPEDAEKKEFLFMKIKTLSNYFFEFLHDKSKKNLVTDYAVAFLDFGDYTKDRSMLKRKHSKKFRVKDFLIENLYKLKEYLNNEKEKNQRENEKRDDGVALLYHVDKYSDYINKKEVFLHKRLVGRKILLHPRQKVTLKKKIIIHPNNVLQKDELIKMSLLIQNNITSLEEIQIEYEKQESEIAIYNNSNEKQKDNRVTVRVLWRDIQYDSLDKIDQENVQFRNVITQDFNLSNEGSYRIIVKDIIFGNEKKPEKCIKLINFNSLSLRPKEYVKLKLVLLVCRKMLKDEIIPMRIITNEKIFYGSVQVLFPYFYFQDIKEEDLEIKIFWTFVLILALKAIYWLISCYQNYKRTKKFNLRPKKMSIKLMSETNLEDKLKIYKAEITLKSLEVYNQQQMLNNNAQIMMMPQQYMSPNNLMQQQQIQQLRYQNSPQMMDKMLNFQNNQILNNYDSNRNILTNINKPVLEETSGISVEQFYQLLDESKNNNESDFLEMNNFSARDKQTFFNNSQIYEEETESRDDNFGSIGNSYSQIKIQYFAEQDSEVDILNEKSGKKKQKRYKLRKRQNTQQNQDNRAFLSNLILQAKLRESNESMSSEEEFEDDESYQEGDDLGEAFGFKPLIQKDKSFKRKISMNSKEYVSDMRRNSGTELSTKNSKRTESKFKELWANQMF